MKKTLITLLGFAALFAASCQPKELVEPFPGERLVPLTLTAEQDGTRTHIEVAPTGWLPYWNDQDSIFVTVGTDLSKAYTFINTSGAGTTATFSGGIKEGEGQMSIYAFTPNKSGRAEDIFKFEIASEQELPDLTTFDPRYDLLISDALAVNVAEGKAYADGKLHFNRMLAIAKVVIADETSDNRLSGRKIKSVKLTSSTQDLSGKVRVKITDRSFDGMESKEKYNYVGATYSGDDWTADGTSGGFLIINPCTLDAGSQLTLDATTDDQGLTFHHAAQLASALELKSGSIPTLKFVIKDQDFATVTTWDFSESGWQAEFAKLGSAATELDPVSLTYAGLTIKADTKSKYNTTYFQPANPGSTAGNHFKFTAPESGTVTVVESHTGSSAPNPLRSIVVNNGGQETTIEGSTSSQNKKTCIFNVVAGDVYVYGTGAARYYSISYVPGQSVDPGNPDNPDPPVSTTADLECTNPPATGTVDPTLMYGFAEAAGVTGGDNASSANVLHFNNGKALQTWLLARTKSEKKGDHSPVTIWLSGTFGPEDGRDFSSAHPWFDVKDVSNLSFYGTDGFVMDRIGIFCVRANNIIIRNINFQQPKANNGADAVSMQECDGVWVDHCTFTSLNQTKDYEDGSTDITHASKNVTVSWCRYIKTQKSCLVGHSNSASADAAITATFHHNWFDGSSSRHPRVRFGQAHVYNNLYDGCTTYGAGSAYGAKVLLEYNYFDGVQLPTDICTYPAKESNESNLQGSVAGYLYPTQNVYVNRPAKAKDPYPLSNVKYTSYNGSTITPLTYDDFKPAYDYVVTAAEDVPAVVKEHSGYGKLGWTEAPVAVNNGGITEFNGTDDDPTNPDVDDPDDPGNPSGGDGGAHTHVFYYDSSSAAKNLTDGAAGTYFTATAKTDLSKDYYSGFNPWTIGDYTSTKGVKLNSSGSVTFTTSASVSSTVQFWFIRRQSSAETAKIQIVPATGTEQVFDTPYDTIGYSGELTLEKGMGYTIKQKSSEQALLLVIVKETE
ncbi:MAG: polysaccharide lyase family 1 protein [Bacteroidales bacterium]|nr:polysaccharide lyase family 1 protein [Bacteroidales bacterium]